MTSSTSCLERTADHRQRQASAGAPDGDVTAGRAGGDEEASFGLARRVGRLELGVHAATHRRAVELYRGAGDDGDYHVTRRRGDFELPLSCTAHDDVTRRGLRPDPAPDGDQLDVTGAGREPGVRTGVLDPDIAGRSLQVDVAAGSVHRDVARAGLDRGGSDLVDANIAASGPDPRVATCVYRNVTGAGFQGGRGEPALEAHVGGTDSDLDRAARRHRQVDVDGRLSTGDAPTMRQGNAQRLVAVVEDARPGDHVECVLVARLRRL